MPLEIIRNDITCMNVDAIVNPTGESLLGSGGASGAIHRAAGPQLLEACRALSGCKTGDAKITAGYNLPARYVIHTVGPVWQGGTSGERELLVSCYRRSLELAAAYNCETVAFPLISTGSYGYPKSEAMQTAIEVIAGFLLDHDMTVYIVVFGREAFELGGKLFHEVTAYIDDVYVQEHTDRRREAARANMMLVRRSVPAASMWNTPPAPSLDDMLAQVDESFAQLLLRKIDERQMTDADCYKRANIDRRLFNKIKNNPAYKPSKQTVLAFTIALEMSPDEAKELLERAGFALTHASKTDIVVEYFLKTRRYNIMDVNQVLFQLDLQPLGY